MWDALRGRRQTLGGVSAPSSDASQEEPPQELVQWLRDRGARENIPDVASAPAKLGGIERDYVLATTRLADLTFEENDYNPREPDKGKIKELQASIIQLSLLTPLTCAYISKEERDTEDDGREAVVLIDGRHRYSALKGLASDPAANGWGRDARVDLKIYYGLARSDLYMLATYLNRARKNLRKGEYYQAVADIYQKREIELREKKGRPVTEVEVFASVNSKAVPDKQFDLSIGRLVALAAFDEEDPKGWYPLVGLSQKDRFEDQREYSPLPAGNLGVFLGHLCLAEAYDDHGEIRAVELTNVVKLGRRFREHVTTSLVPNYMEATGITIASKHWVLDAFGAILAESSLFAKAKQAGRQPLAVTSVDWKSLDKVLIAYRRVMDEQAVAVNAIRREETPPKDFLVKAWTYQTQTKQIVGPLREQLQRKLHGEGIEV